MPDRFEPDPISRQVAVRIECDPLKLAALLKKYRTRRWRRDPETGRRQLVFSQKTLAWHLGVSSRLIIALESGAWPHGEPPRMSLLSDLSCVLELSAAESSELLAVSGYRVDEISEQVVVLKRILSRLDSLEFRFRTLERAMAIYDTGTQQGWLPKE
jgi:DNA-binding XRE family transcriptional regulator